MLWTTQAEGRRGLVSEKVRGCEAIEGMKEGRYYERGSQVMTRVANGEASKRPNGDSSSLSTQAPAVRIAGPFRCNRGGHYADENMLEMTCGVHSKDDIEVTVILGVSRAVINQALRMMVHRSSRVEENDKHPHPFGLALVLPSMHSTSLY
jgi:hypothetical protein